MSSDDEDSEKTTGLQEDRDLYVDCHIHSTHMSGTQTPVHCSYSEIVENLAKLICQMRGQDASVAISHIVHVYREMSQCQRTEGNAVVCPGHASPSNLP